ncbi:MAG: flagella basal body P-ring formation protein FlgA [Lentisphaeria bacterium]|jgi:flagella basal body P-ring formation protein FlgA
MTSHNLLTAYLLTRAARLAAVAVLLGWSLSTWSVESQNINELENRVKAYASKYYSDAYGSQIFEESIQISVGNLDSRLRLAACDDNLSFKLLEPPHNAHNISVKTTCEGELRWTVYIPATIDIFTDVLVANKSLAKGYILNENDVGFKRVNIAKSRRGYIEDVTRAAGMELKRPLQAGTPIQLNALKAPNMVLKGQTVVMTSSSKFLSIETKGVALSSGIKGEQIKVKNSNSNRVISAKITAPGEVSVANR